MLVLMGVSGYGFVCDYTDDVPDCDGYEEKIIFSLGILLLLGEKRNEWS